MKSTSILLEEKHLKWAKDNSINISAWVRKRIDEEIEKQKR